jgi:hypothetical protein
LHDTLGVFRTKKAAVNGFVTFIKSLDKKLLKNTTLEKVEDKIVEGVKALKKAEYFHIMGGPYFEIREFTIGELRG